MPLKNSRRISRAFSSTASSGVARVITVAVSFLTVPLTSEYLGPEKFGVWMTLVSLTAFFAFADLGVGNGLINLVSEASTRPCSRDINTYIASAYSVVVLVALGLGAAFLLLFDELPKRWPSIFADPAVPEVSAALAVFVTCLLVQLPANLVQKIRIGLQEGYVNGIWNIASSGVVLVLLIAGITFQAGLPTLVLILSGGPVIVASAHTLQFFLTSGRSYLPRYCDLKVSVMKTMGTLGGAYLALQIIAAFTTSSDNLIIASAHSVADVGDYAVAVKLFGVIGIGAGLLLQPLWPMYAESIASGDEVWARTIFLRCTAGLALLALSLGALLCLIFDDVMLLWMGRRLAVSHELIVGLAAWCVTDAMSMSIATYLNGRRVLIPQVAFGALACAVSLSTKLWLIQRVGLYVLPWIATGVTTVFFILPMLILAVKHKREADDHC